MMRFILLSQNKRHWCSTALGNATFNLHSIIRGNIDTKEDVRLKDIPF